LFSSPGLIPEQENPATALLLAHFRETGVRALAMKPFCSGAREDAKLLFELNDRQVPIESVNPFIFENHWRLWLPQIDGTDYFVSADAYESS
jgi:hypothetical protein